MERCKADEYICTAIQKEWRDLYCAGVGTETADQYEMLKKMMVWVRQNCNRKKGRLHEEDIVETPVWTWRCSQADKT
jgi:hypothetical protein